MTAVQKVERPPLWRDIRVLRVVLQVVVVAVVVAGVRQLILNLINGLEATGIDTSFDFLSQRTGFRVAESNFNPNSPSRELFLVGIKNTLAIAGVGIAIASVVGLVVGIGRLSTNWLVAKLSALFVETLRNIPPLVVIIFFFAAIFRNLTPVREASKVSFPLFNGDGLIYSNSQWAVPWFIAGDNSGSFWTLMGVALVAAIGVWIWRTRREIATGAPARRVLFATVILVGTAAVGSLAMSPFSPSWPTLDGNRIVGGFEFTTSYLAVTLALGLYTASHIAEIIRGSIQAVHKGQVEAAQALALSGFQRYRFIVLPQALRIAIPPVINQFLNLTKNTSLAVAVAFPELTNLTKSLIGNGKPAPQSILILMAAYLSFSLTISLFVNFLNRRMQLVTR